MPISPLLKQQNVGGREINAASLGRRILASINFPLLFVTAALLAYGLLIVYSAILGNPDYAFSRQITGVAIGLVAMGALWVFDYQKLSTFAFPLLILSMFLIILPLIPGLGVNINGANNWIRFFGLQVQPSEFAKPLIILFGAALVGKYRGHINDGREYFRALGLLMLPVVGVMMQPDMGTALVFLVFAMVVLFAGGANRKWLLLTIVGMIAALVFIIALDGFLDNVLGVDTLIKEYQKNRILVFLNNDIDPTGISYNLRQSKIAIGSGGLFGQGFGNASQAELNFLPEYATDFIFCVLAQQFGFVGSMALIALYVLLFFVSLTIAFAAKDSFGTLIAAGVTGMWVFHVFQNIGMTMGLMPITGIPLPFVSYGSSFMLVNFVCLGLLCSVWAHRDNKTRKKV
ncbi:MAG: rod shape-determining protein RodA [Coriobacteriales bacterium]|jgi:rod shape determining protein RodA|nr:rod shape-determining protein RodA [Coriobacteriales bacterium]